MKGEKGERSPPEERISVERQVRLLPPPSYTGFALGHFEKNSHTQEWLIELGSAQKPDIRTKGQRERRVAGKRKKEIRKGGQKLKGMSGPRSLSDTRYFANRKQAGNCETQTKSTRESMVVFALVKEAKKCEKMGKQTLLQ